MDSNTHLDLEHQNHQPNSGLLRFRSAPTSLLTNFVDNNGDLGVNKGNSIEGSDHSDRFFSRFVNYSHTNDSESWPSSLQEFEDKSTVTASRMSAQQQGFPGLPPHYPRQSSFGSGNGSYGLVGSAAVDHHPQAKTVSSNLVRQSSSPAGLFSNSSVQNGRRKWRIDGDIGYQGHPYAISRFGLGSCNRLLNVFQNTIKGTGNMERVVLIGIWEGPSTNKVENSRFPFGAWNDPSNFSENLAGMRRDQDNDVKLFSAAQNGDLGNRIHVLSHHLSLPKNSAEVAMEKFLQFQDSVPCKVRAKRGCATHPRSIAERVRRTRISERMRKLQELVPNMDKQTNTADMLDLAVDYIKELQKQFKSLSDVRANCKCLSMQKPVQNQIV